MEGGIKSSSHIQPYSGNKKALSFYSPHTSWLFILILFTLLITPACQDTEKPLAPAIENRDSVPVMQTETVTTLISDSGIIKYRIITESWDIYDRADVPQWKFEKGFYLEQFDRDYHVTATIKSDTAYNYTREKLWELRGNVQIMNERGDKFFTSLLFWDQNSERVYSNKKIRIEQSDKIINGTSFESNQDMTIYTIQNTVGHVNFEEEKLQRPAAGSDSIRSSSESDSTNTNRSLPPPPVLESTTDSLPTQP